MARWVRGGRLRFTTNLASTVAEADVLFIAVGTLSRREDGYADARYVEARPWRWRGRSLARPT